MSDRPHTFTVTSPAGPRMNRMKVVVWMTVGVCAMLLGITLGGFGGLPPWPVLLSFAVSHVFFCAVVLSVKPFRGPYTTPMLNRGSDSR